MPKIPVENVGKVGLIKDLAPHELPPEAWSTVLNVVFRNGQVEKRGGQETVFVTPTNDPHAVIPWDVLTEQRWIYPSSTKIYYTDGAAETDITRYTTTPGDNDYTGGARPVWSGGVLGGIPVLNHDNLTDYPQQWDSALVRMKDLDNWPVNTYAKIMRIYDNILVALDITESGTRDQFKLKWSHPAPAGSVPVSWDPTDATKLAGERIFAQNDGKLVDCLPLRGINFIYLEQGIWSMSPIGGSDVFGWRGVVRTEGLLSPRAVKEWQGVHFVVGQNDIYLFDGSRPQSIATHRVRKWFFDTISSTYKHLTIVTPYYARNEMWISFVSSSATGLYLDTALIWNWAENTWTVRELPDITHIAYGEVTTGGLTIDDLTGPIDSYTQPIDTLGGGTTAQQLVMARAGTSKGFLVVGTTQTDEGSNFTSLVERTGLAIVGRGRDGQPKVDPTIRKFLRAIYPKMEVTSSTTINVYAGYQDSLNSPVIWEGPRAFDPTVDDFVEFDDVHGRYLGVRFEDASGNLSKLSGYVLDIEVTSRY